MGCLNFLLPIELGEAELLIISPNNQKSVKVKFILRTYKLTKKNIFAEIGSQAATRHSQANSL